MKKRLSREEKLKQATVDIINKMFEIAGHPVTYEDIKDRKDAWYQEWTMTTEQNKEWQKWGKQYLMKNFRNLELCLCPCSTILEECLG